VRIRDCLSRKEAEDRWSEAGTVKAEEEAEDPSWETECVWAEEEAEDPSWETEFRYLMTLKISESIYDV
jgi:hypothetical protein